MGALETYSSCMEITFLIFTFVFMDFAGTQSAGIGCLNIKALGMESDAILNSQITQSTLFSQQYSGFKARLNQQGAWYAQTSDTAPWIQVDLGRRKIVTGIAIQGSVDGYVKSYYLKYRDGGNTWTNYTENGATKNFQGNTDRVNVKNTTISPYIIAQYIKLYALTWEKYCSLRMELYGCNYPSPTLPPSVSTTARTGCKKLLLPQGSSLVCTSSSYTGSVCNFSCNAGFKLVGNHRLTCQSDGTWDFTEPACYRLPGQPTNLQFTDVSAKTLSISWTKPSDGSSTIIDYTVRWKAVTESSPQQKVVASPKATLQVKPYTTYVIDVKARNSYGQSVWSAKVNQQSDEAAPSMSPAHFKLTSTKSLSLTVSWNEIPPEGRHGIVLGYVIYYYKSGSPLQVFQQGVGPTSLTYTISNLDYSAYYVSVAGHTRIAVGIKTSPMRLKPKEGAPTAPVNVKAIVKGSTSVLVQWTTPVKPNGDIRKYIIKYGTVKEQLTGIKDTQQPVNESLVSPLEEFSTYFFLVYAETSITGHPTQIVSATTTDDVPDAVPHITSSAARDAYSIYVSWKEIPPINRNGVILGYTVFYKFSGQGKPRNVTFHDKNKLSTEITGLRPYTQYCIRMAAFTRVGLSRNWDTKQCSWTITLETGPSSPMDVKVKAISSIAMLVEWKIPTHPNGMISKYIVYYGSQKDKFDTNVEVTGDTLSALIRGLRKFTSYYVRVRGNTTKPGNASKVVTVKTMEDIPSAPVLFRGQAVSSDSILLLWKKPTEANGILRWYLIRTYEKKTGKQVGDVVNVTALNIPEFIHHLVSGLKPFRDYIATIQAYTIGLGPLVNCSVMTEEGVSSAPRNVQVTLTDMSIEVEWKEPLEHNGYIRKYTVHCIGTRSYQQSFSDPQIAYVARTTFSYRVSKVEPGTQYKVYVTAVTRKGDGERSEVIIITTPSKRPPAPSVPSFQINSVTSTSVSIILNASPAKNGEVIAHQVIVKKLNGVAKRSTDQLPYHIDDYRTATEKGSPYYLAAEFRGSTVPSKFVLGDGEVYKGYYNAPLEPETNYKVYVRGVTRNEDGKWVYGKSSGVILPQTGDANLFNAHNNLTALNSTFNTKSPKIAGSDNNVGLIAGIVGTLILIGIIGIAVLLYRRSKRPLKANMDCENPKSKSKRRLKDLEFRRLASKKRPMSFPGEVTNDPDHPPVTVDHFAKHVHKLHKSDDRGFMIEYNKLDSGREFPCDNAYLTDNKTKNRYGNIVAYDHSRVVLSVVDDAPCTDYVNASHIDGYNKPNAYIATQGPVPPTFNDFWRMVWEKQSSTVVMLTNLQERHKLKCHKYWPDETEDYGDITVRLLKSEHYADYSIRTFNVKRDCEKEEREVKQFHFIVWPDHGVPEYATAILAFRRRVRAYNPPDAGPIIVHCSAGVGRSGTFIVIDTMLDRSNAENTIDIFNFVAYLRSRRTAMVQTEEQYTFCHDAILESLQCGNTQILAHDLRIALSKMDVIDKERKISRFEAEFKTLNKVSPVLAKACYIVATYPENKEKNRYHDILASDFSRVMLTAIDDNEITTYINAVHISGYKQQHAFIVTQYPLTATVTDYWRMLCEQDSACVVVFQPSEEGDYPQFWPEVGTETYDDMITVQCHDEKSNSVDNLKSMYNQSEISEVIFKVKDLRTPEKVHKVKMFMVSGWSSEDEPPSSSAMITLTAKVEKWQQQSGNGPITVVCSDGIGRSGTFCALYSVLERVKIEQVVDVLQAIKAMRIPRPGLVKTTAEYKFIHYAVQEYLTAFDDYANFK